MTKTMFNAELFRQQHQQRTGHRSGFPTDTDRAQLPHVVDLAGVTPANLGHDRCCDVYHAVLRAADAAASGNFILEATYDRWTWERTGYTVLLPDPIVADRVRAASDASQGSA